MRRRFFLFAAPAIVAAPSLMKVSALVLPPEPVFDLNNLVTETIQARLPFLIENIQQTNALLARMSGIPSFLYGQYDGCVAAEPATILLTS